MRQTVKQRQGISQYLLLLLFFFTAACLSSANAETVTYRSTDGLLITADLYAPHPLKKTPIVVLFHQAGSSRGEYNEIAPRLNKLGFNCIAVDARSGEYSRGKDNQTAIRAGKKDLPSSYADALPDIIASLEYARKHYPNSKVIAWGSSYSAALVLKVAGDHPELADAVLAFSPGEYFAHLGKSKTWIQDAAKYIDIPVFITSARNESDSWRVIYDVIPSKNKTGFIPDTSGHHGSRALWKKYDDSESYWQAVTAFFTDASVK